MRWTGAKSLGMRWKVYRSQFTHNNLNVSESHFLPFEIFQFLKCRWSNRLQNCVLSSFLLRFSIQLLHSQLFKYSTFSNHRRISRNLQVNRRPIDDKHFFLNSTCNCYKNEARERREKRPNKPINCNQSLFSHGEGWKNAF